MKTILKLITSTRLMGLLIIVFALAMAVATFIENDFATDTAKILIYNAWWFEFIMLMLTINFIGSIFKYKLYRRDQLPILTFHIAFIVILLGAFITRYFGYEGMMLIREGRSSNTILSDKTYFNLVVDNGKEQLDFEKEVLFGVVYNRSFKIKSRFREIPFAVKYNDYIPNAKSKFVLDDQAESHLHLVVSDASGRKDVYIPNGKIIPLGNTFVSFNKPMLGVVNFIGHSKKDLYLQPISEGTYMKMQTQERFKVYKDSLKPAHLLKLYQFSELDFVIPEAPVRGRKVIVQADKSEKKQYPLGALILDVSSGNKQEQIVVQGRRGSVNLTKKISLNGLNFTMQYGSKPIIMPFALKLRDFQLERYPGTNSPSSYASEVTVVDQPNSFDYKIYMNHVLDYKGYRFFQSSYDADEKGTVLSVNHDYWGTLITYIGYILMGVSMILTLFWKKSRFSSLLKRVNKLGVRYRDKVLIIILLSSVNVWGQNTPQSKDTIKKFIVNKQHAEQFGQLLIQDHSGRIKPINTYALQALRKVYKKDNYQGLTAEQVLLSAHLDPYTWGEEYIISVKSNVLGQTISNNLSVKDGYVSAANFYKTGRYYLADKISEISVKKNIDRTATDKEIVNLDDRFNVWLSMLNGGLLRIYPRVGDDNNTWFSGVDVKSLVKQDTMILSMHKLYMITLAEAVKTDDYSKADEYLRLIKNYQLTQGASVIPPLKQVELEIQYNKSNIFKHLLFVYFFIGFLLFTLAFLELFSDKKWLKFSQIILLCAVVLAIVLHAIGLGVRWYISGHAPWSNAHESLVFMALVSALSGVCFVKNKSSFIVAVAVVFSSLLLGVAHGGSMNPEITNLVPVLKSYWLNIHVAVITASYMFLSLGSLLGFVNLVLVMLVGPSNLKITKTYKELTLINETALTIGLFALSIGTFLGGVWANESWGRYWSWDPKEVWSLISMIVYVFVLHMRMIPGLKNKFVFNTVSMWAISTLIMTFFGVNYYLSGMHSYAGGDSVPFPVWAYYTIILLLLFNVLAYVFYRKNKNYI